MSGCQISALSPKRRGSDSSGPAAKRLATTSSSKSANISGIKTSAVTAPLYSSEQYALARKPLLENERNKFSFDPRQIWENETLRSLREHALSQPHFDLLSSVFLDSHFHPEDLTYKDHVTFEQWRSGMSNMKLNDTAPIFGGAVAILCNPTVYCQGVKTPPKCSEQLDRKRFQKHISAVFEETTFPQQYVLGVVMGVHPKWAAHYNHNRKLIDQRITDLASTAQNDMDGHKVVGIGETGFCFKKIEHAVIPDDLEKIPQGKEQEKAFIAHMQLAKACAMPLITHIRGGSDELTEQLEIYSMQLCSKYLPSDHIIIRHCFVRSARIAAMWRSHFPNVVFSHAPTLCDDRRNASEKQTVTDFWLRHQMAESDAPHFFHDGKYLGNSGLVPRVYRKIMRLRRAETPEDRRAIQYYLTSNVLTAYRIDIRHWEESWRRLISGEDSDDALAAVGLIETDAMDTESGPSTSAAAARGPSTFEGHEDEHEGNIAQGDSDLDESEVLEPRHRSGSTQEKLSVTLQVQTELSAGVSDLPVDQTTGFPSFPPETPLDVRRAFSSFSIDNSSNTSLELFHECTGQGGHISCIPIRVRDVMPKTFTTTEVEDLVARSPLQAILVRWVGRLFPRPGQAVFNFVRDLLRSGSVYKSILVYEDHCNDLRELPECGPVDTVTKDDVSAGYFRWAKSCRMAQRFLFEHPRGPFTTGFQFPKQLCGRSYQTWERLNFTHAIDEVRCKVNPRHARMMYLPAVLSRSGDCEALCICDRRGQALVAGLTLRQDEYASDPRQALSFVSRRYLPYCVTTLVICCGADRLYEDPSYRAYEADVRDLTDYLSQFYPYLRVRIIHPMFVPERLEQWADVIMPAKDNLRHQMAAVDEPRDKEQTHLLYIDLSVDRDLLKFHRRTGHKSPELVTPSGYVTFFGVEMRLNEIWRCYGLDLGDTADPASEPVPQAVIAPLPQHPRDISGNTSQTRVQTPQVSVPGNLQVFVRPDQLSRYVQNVSGTAQKPAFRKTPVGQHPSRAMNASGSGPQSARLAPHHGSGASTTAMASNVDMDLIRQAVREVMQERSGQAAEAPPAGGARGHRRDDEGTRDGRGRSRERGGNGPERSSTGRGPSLSDRRHH